MNSVILPIVNFVEFGCVHPLEDIKCMVLLFKSEDPEQV